MSVSAVVNVMRTLRTGEAPSPGGMPQLGGLPLGMREVTPREQMAPATRGGASGASGGREISAFMDSVAELESGGNYEAVGPPTRLGRARGKYQIMDANWDAWAAEAGIPGADWRDPQAQDRVARHKFMQYRREFGRWDAVAVAWFAGPGAARQYVNNPASVEGRSDVLGTNVRQYVDRVMGGFNERRGSGRASGRSARPVSRQTSAGAVHAPDGVWDRQSVGEAARHIADSFGVDLTSHWRSEEHNERVGGADDSDHLWGGGVDFAGSEEDMRALVDWAGQFTGPNGPFRIVLHPWNDPSGHGGDNAHVHISFHRNNSQPITLNNLGGELKPASFQASSHVSDHVASAGGATAGILGAFRRTIGGETIGSGIGDLAGRIARPQDQQPEPSGAGGGPPLQPL